MTTTKKRKPHDTFSGGSVTVAGLKPAPGSGAGAAIVQPARVRGQVSLWAPETGQMVTGRYSEPPQVVAERTSNGAWVDVPRLKRRPLSSWTGPGRVKIECKIRFRDLSVAATLQRLRGLQDRLPGVDVDDRPPYLLVLGYTPGHYDAAAMQWQIDGLTVVEETTNGVPTSALVTVVLAEWVDSRVDLEVAKTRTAARAYTWRKGDRLRTVAKSQLGSAGSQAQRAIRDANPSIRTWTN